MDKQFSTIDRPINLDNVIVPNNVEKNWQDIVDLVAKLVDVPIASICRKHNLLMKVFVSSTNPENFFPKGSSYELGSGYYCDTVLEKKSQLLVRNALKDPDWVDSPDIDYGLISYLGYPLTWPNGEIFGTFCILDKKENSFNAQ